MGSCSSTSRQKGMISRKLAHSLSKKKNFANSFRQPLDPNSTDKPLCLHSFSARKEIEHPPKTNISISWHVHVIRSRFCNEAPCAPQSRHRHSVLMRSGKHTIIGGSANPRSPMILQEKSIQHQTEESLSIHRQFFFFFLTPCPPTPP